MKKKKKSSKHKLAKKKGGRKKKKQETIQDNLRKVARPIVTPIRPITVMPRKLGRMKLF